MWRLWGACLVRTLYLDTETTGLNVRLDRIVEIAIVDDHGGVVIDTLVNPGLSIPSQASQIHHITDAMVRTAPSLEILWPKIAALVRGNRIVIYNKQYDIKFFPDQLACAGDIQCAMLAYAALRGEKTTKRGGFRRHKLLDAAAHVGHQWSGPAHRARGDAEACRSVWLWTNRQIEVRQQQPSRILAPPAPPPLRSAGRSNTGVYSIPGFKNEKPSQAPPTSRPPPAPVPAGKADTGVYSIPGYKSTGPEQTKPYDASAFADDVRSSNASISQRQQPSGVFVVCLLVAGLLALVWFLNHY